MSYRLAGHVTQFVGHAMQPDWTADAEEVFKRELAAIKNLVGFWVLVADGDLIGVFATKEAAEFSIAILGARRATMRRITSMEEVFLQISRSDPV